MRKPKPERLPKHPDWKLVPEPNRETGPLTLRYGVALLRIRFWPRASAALRMTPEGPWISGDRHAGRLLRRYFNRVRFRHVPIDGKLHWVDPDGQLYFPFIPQHREEMGNTPAERAYIRAISQIPHEIGATLLQYKTSYWEALRLASRLPAAGELLVSNPQLFWLWLRDMHSNVRSFTESNGLKLQMLRGNLQHPQHIQLSMLGLSSKKFWLRVLKKVPLCSLNNIDWNLFSKFTRSHVDSRLIKYLQHAEKLPAPLLQSLADPATRSVLNDQLMHSCLQKPSRTLYQRLTILHRFQSKFPTANELMRRPTSTHQLGVIARDFGDLLLRERPQVAEPKSSPFETPEGWTHLNTMDRIIGEGILQGNCLKNDPASFLEGSDLLYRVEKPVRATLHVDHTESGHWYVRQCAGPRNEHLTPQVQHDLLCKLTGRVMPDLKSLPRVNYPAILTESTPLYQRLGNSRALWALYSTGKLALPPEALEDDLHRGQSVIYRMRLPHECVFRINWDSDYGWQLGALLYTEARRYSPAHFRLAAHILWQHYADLNAHGFEAPAWTMPQLALQNYRPVRNIWELLDFCWQTGSAISLKDILENGWCPFYCKVHGHEFAIVAIPIFDFWDIHHAYAVEPGVLNEDTEEARRLQESISQEIIRPFDSVEEEPIQRPADETDRYAPPPRLPKLKHAQDLDQPPYQRVHL